MSGTKASNHVYMCNMCELRIDMPVAVSRAFTDGGSGQLAIGKF